MGKDFAGSANHQAIQREVWDVIQGTSGDGWVATHFKCLVDTWMRSDNTGTQSIYWNDVYPGNIAPELWDQIWQDLQNHHVILMLVCVVR